MFKKIAAITILGAMFSASALPQSTATQYLGDKSAESPIPEWAQNAVIYEANLRQGTSSRDLKGLQAELPRLKELGVDIIWLMPIHPISEKNRKGTLGSYYAVKDYKAVNPEFGTFDDLKALVADAHSRGMKVIIDEVCNHTGCDNAWTTEHPEYYARNEKGEMFGPFDWTDTYKLDYSNAGTREAMADALEYWVREADIDGYRCDVAGEVPTDFWEEVRPRLQAIKPVFMLAEASKPDLLVKAFDADYAWPMKDLFNAIAATEGVNRYATQHGQNLPSKNASDIQKLLERQKTEYPAGSINMNMVTNHDLNSWEGTEFERYGEAVPAFAVLSYTLPGMPMMYTGQEVGFDHAFEFFETDPVQPDYAENATTGFYRRLNQLKHENKALNAREAGAKMEFLPVSSEKVVAFSRVNGDNQVITIVNLSGEEQPVEFTASSPCVKNLKDWQTGESAKLPKTLAPWGYTVLYGAPSPAGCCK